MLISWGITWHCMGTAWVTYGHLARPTTVLYLDKMRLEASVSSDGFHHGTMLAPSQELSNSQCLPVSWAAVLVCP